MAVVRQLAVKVQMKRNSVFEELRPRVKRL